MEPNVKYGTILLKSICIGWNLFWNSNDILGAVNIVM